MVGNTHTDDQEEKDPNDKFMGGLREKLKGTSLYDAKVKAVHLKHRIGKFQNLGNKNHRHDEDIEIEVDNKRTAIAEGHRFQSFAPTRDGNLVKWYIDGRDYFHAVSVALEQAKESIYIADWWLSPELFLRRPPHFHQEWRLDQTLKRAAERGVKIYINLYREVAAALTCNSEHSKKALEALCPEGSPGYGNIVIMRHPDHNVLENGSDMTFMWAHHEKFIVVDYDLAFIGGLDLCFGRWDVRQHVLSDLHPASVELEMFPGQDFNNNRIMDFDTVQDWQSNSLSKTEYGRMPWHDVAMGLVGPCVYDIAEHFVLRWNFVKRDKYKRDDEYDWLILDGTDEDIVGVQRPKHPVGEYITHPFSPLEHKKGRPNQGYLGNAEAHAESGADEFYDAPENPGDHGYNEDQHRTPETWLSDFTGNMKEKGVRRPHMVEGLSTRLHPHAATRQNPSYRQENEKMTGNDTKNEGTVTASGGVTEKSKGYRSNIAGDEVTGGHGTVRAQIVRSSADWSSGILTEQSIQNAYCEVIRNAQHYVYIENQFFITATGDQQSPIHNLIGKAIVDACAAADKEKRKFRVIVILPAIPGFAGDLRTDAAAGTRAIMDYQYKSICRGEHSIFGRLRAQNVDPNQYIFFFNLRSYDRINNTPEFKKLEETSGVTYAELQQLQAEEIMQGATSGRKKGISTGDAASKSKKPTGLRALLRSKGKEELQGSESESDLDPEEEEAAGAEAAEKKLKLQERRGDLDLTDGAKIDKLLASDSIAQDAMLGQPKVSEEAWAGHDAAQMDGLHEDDGRDAEKENFIQEQLYIHGKTLIADDRIVICGSSNINDRSQLGFHDSELAIVMEDTRSLDSKMDGKDFTAGLHAASLRRMLWREHLGLLPAQRFDATEDFNAQPPDAQLPGHGGINEYSSGDEWDEFVTDPLSDKLWEMWTERASVNTQIFRILFHADPDQNIKDFAEYDKFMPHDSHKTGHLYDPYQPVEAVRTALDRIKGHLVWFPLRFLENESMVERGLQVNSWTESVYT